MAELPALPDVVRSAADVTNPPPFEAIVRRGRRRRRRHVVGGIAAAAVAVVAVVGGVALAGHDSAAGPVAPSRAPSPAPPSKSPGPTKHKTPQQIVATGYVDSYAADADGDLMTVWRTCRASYSEGCHYAWELRNHTGASVLGAGPGGVPNLYTGGHYFVLRAYDHDGIVVDGSSGHARLLANAQRGNFAAGNVFVRYGSGLMVVDPAAASGWPMPTPGGASPWETAARGGDRTWAMAYPTNHGLLSVAWAADGSTTWHAHTLPGSAGALPGYMAASGSRVATFAGGDGATILPVVDLAVSIDDGQTWSDLTRDDVPFKDIWSMSATSDGVLFVANAAGRLYRSTDSTWTHFVRVPISGQVVQVEDMGAKVVVRIGWDAVPRLLSVDGSGTTRALAPLR